jgi:uncharacterized protein (TIGR02284 family)
MNHEKTVEVLNTLITINNDRIEGYEKAAKETEELDLKIAFNKFEATSKKCNNELESEVIKLGGTPAEGTRTSGKFFRVWMDVKAALTGKDRKFILDSCEYGEDVAKETYASALKHHATDLNAELQTMIKAQHVLLVADHDKVKSMRDVLAAA